MYCKRVGYYLLLETSQHLFCVGNLYQVGVVLKSRHCLFVLPDIWILEKCICFMWSTDFCPVSPISTSVAWDHYEWCISIMNLHVTLETILLLFTSINRKCLRKYIWKWHKNLEMHKIPVYFIWNFHISKFLVTFQIRHFLLAHVRKLNIFLVW